MQMYTHVYTEHAHMYTHRYIRMYVDVHRPGMPAEPHTAIGLLELAWAAGSAATCEAMLASEERRSA